MEYYDFPYIGNNDPSWRTHIFPEGLKPPTQIETKKKEDTRFVTHKQNSRRFFLGHTVSFADEQLDQIGLIFPT